MRSTFSLQQKRTAQLVLAAACLGVYAPALYAPVDPQSGQGSRQIVFNMGTVVDEIETKIDAIAMDGIGTFTVLDAIDAQVKTIDSKVDVLDAELGLVQSTVEVVESKLDDCCATLNSKVDVLDTNVDALLLDTATIESKIDVIDTEVGLVQSTAEVVESKLDACCATLNSKVDVLDTNVDALLLDTATIESKIDVIDTEVGLAQSTVEVVESKLDACCATLNSKVDEVFVDFQETWTILGAQTQVSVSGDDLNTLDEINTSTLSVIQWLKTIYRFQRGL